RVPFFVGAGTNGFFGILYLFRAKLRQLVSGIFENGIEYHIVNIGMIQKHSKRNPSTLPLTKIYLSVIFTVQF
ncbi:MAG: hypothetical protein LBH75_08030, partial [Treponema sp.]|nr:hypothetical protein [Treponema sp.]